MNPVSGGPVGKTEDEQSVASYVTFGKFRVLYLGDFTWNQEFDLMCPNNRIGAVDLFIASRHGQPSSNSEALVHAVRPRVTIMNNGSRKGGQPAAMNMLLNSPASRISGRFISRCSAARSTPCLECSSPTSRRRPPSRSRR